MCGVCGCVGWVGCGEVGVSDGCVGLLVGWGGVWCVGVWVG